MEKTATIKVSVCDFCGASGCYYSCESCRKDICWDCRKTEAVYYYHSVHCQGSGDGVYCHECNTTPDVVNSEKHRAYRVIQDLRNEENGWWQHFLERSKEAELALEACQAQEKHSG